MKFKKIILICTSFILLFACSFFITFKLSEMKDKEAGKQPKENLTITTGEETKEAKPDTPIVSEKDDKDVSPKLSEVMLSSVGDCTIGWDSKYSYSGSLGQVFNSSGKDYSYFFKNVVHIFKKDDITTANLETTFTNADKKADKKFTFKAPPEYAKSLTLGDIEGVNISNNHIKDYLERGFQDTKNTLKKENINYFGEGQKWITEVDGNKFGFLGYKGFTYNNAFLNTLKKDIQELKSQNCTVVINFHWGIERAYNPNSVQKYIAHYSIDNGADLIIGHHPHVIQSIEKYKGKIIAYSLGNFAFGGNKNPSDKDTFILQTNFKFEDSKLKSYGIKIIPCSVSSVSYKNDYCPTPLSGSKKTAVLNKLNKLSINLDFKLSDDFHYIDVNN